MRVRLNRGKSIGSGVAGLWQEKYIQGNFCEEEVIGQNMHPRPHKLLYNSHFAEQFCHIS